MLRTALLVLAIVVTAVLAVRAFVSIYTNALWFRSVHHGDVYGRQFATQALMFGIFAIVMAIVVAGSLIHAYRSRSVDLPDPNRQRTRWQFRQRIDPYRAWLLLVVTAYLAIQMGSRAARSWQVWLQWRNSTSFGMKDPQFHRDISYFLFVYPMHRLVVSLLLRAVVTGLAVMLVAGYAYGGFTLRGSPRFRPGLLRGLSLLLGAAFALKAAGYWLDRFGLATSNRGVVTGPSYTDIHAVLVDKVILLVLALLFAVALFANLAVAGSRLLWASAVGMAVSVLVLGLGVPALVQQFKAKPSASKLELPSVQRNIDATRAAFDLPDASITTEPLTPLEQQTATQLSGQALANAEYRLLDPNVISPTLTSLQEIRPYYGFKSTLDVDRYDVDGSPHDVLIAVRELQQTGLPAGKRTWTNTHLVYTHGYGAVATLTSRLDSQGNPPLIEKDIPPTGVLGDFRPQIYFGQMSPSYSIVGARPGAKPIEFDRPAGSASQQNNTTYSGGDGVSIGSRFRRLVYALKYHSSSILFSNQINHNSQLLSVRNPRARVAALAPWLTLDGDSYPVVTGGHVLWVVDGYTTSGNYPYSQQQNLRGATSTTLSAKGSTVTQPNGRINYIRNSVKATVDAYTGEVTLYEWDQGGDRRDPVLATWEKSFPGLVHPQRDIPAHLLPHLRYPQDLFNLQRTVLSSYHVTDAQDFYNGANVWKVPTDPTQSASSRKNSFGRKVTQAAPAQPSAYFSVSANGDSTPRFALSTPLVTLDRRNLAAYLSVDSRPGPDYGHFTLLTLPPGQASPGLTQIQNAIESDPTVAQQLTLLRTGKSRVVLGNMLLVPVGGKIMYVEPVYTQAIGPNTFPTLRKIVAVYGDGKPVFTTSLEAAIAGAVGK